MAAISRRILESNQAACRQNQNEPSQVRVEPVGCAFLEGKWDPRPLSAINLTTELIVLGCFSACSLDRCHYRMASSSPFGGLTGVEPACL
jgi:hypothetical protein